MIYLDNASTTQMLPCVREATLPWLSGERFGNASTLHSAGREARKAVEESRQNVAKLINADKSEIFFTSGGTESDNAAIMGLMQYLQVIGKRRIVVSEIEHHAILKMQSRLKMAGMRMELAPVKENGEVDYDQLFEMVSDGHVGLVSVMLANNEIGTVQDLALISEFCHEHDCLVHTDAVQAIGHMRVDVEELGVDMLSMSGHKFGAMQGVGALYIRSAIRPYFAPMIVGGGQERGIRSGTENVAGIVSIGAAACHMTSMIDYYTGKYNDLNFCLLNALRKEKIMERINSNRDGVYSLPNIISLTYPGVEAEALLRLMNAEGVCISAASACSASSLAPSHVLKAIGMTDEGARQTIRISLGVNNTKDEMEEVARLLSKNVTRIRNLYR